jgi:uncharacterized RDD family membrane protein YckC
MTDPAGGAPQAPIPPQPDAPPPAAAPAPPPAGGSWNAPPPAAAPGQFNPNFQQAAVEAGPAPGIAYGDIVTRIIALVIDSVILWIPYVVVTAIVGGIFIASGGFGLFTIVSLVLGVAYAALAGAYFVWTWTTQRASYGMKFLKLECVNAADGATLTRDQAIKRFLYLYAGNLIAIVGQNVFGLGLGSLFALVGLGYIVYLLYTTSQSPKRQGFHDIQAGTVVVKHV